MSRAGIGLGHDLARANGHMRGARIRERAPGNVEHFQRLATEAEARGDEHLADHYRRKLKWWKSRCA